MKPVISYPQRKAEIMNRLKLRFWQKVNGRPYNPGGWTIAVGLAFIAAALIIAAFLGKHPHE